MEVVETDNLFEVQIPAKINLCLLVGPRRSDGYHPICSLMEEISLYDTLRARRAPGAGIRLKVAGIGGKASAAGGPHPAVRGLQPARTPIMSSEADPARAPAPVAIPAQKNTVMLAARALERAAGVRFDVELELTKRIPVAAGLGGGSADAAAALRLLAAMYGLDVPEREMARLALSVGADVPFFLTPGPKLVEGAGERLSATGPLPGHALVLAAPDFALAADYAYRRFDELKAAASARAVTGAAAPAVAENAAADFERRCTAMRGAAGRLADFAALAALLANDLEAPAVTICHAIEAARRALVAAGSPAVLVSGSGPVVFGLFPDEAVARTATERLALDGARIVVVKPLILV